VPTTPKKHDCNITDLDLSKGKVALVLGTEIDGITDTVFEMADEFVKIPMYGFTESFNISVTAAMCLHTLSGKLRNSNIDWKLSEEELLKLKTDWVRNILTKPDLVEAEFWKLKAGSGTKEA
jgi:tRNA (guanosine-2'-O-)-methyltransferase